MTKFEPGALPTDTTLIKSYEYAVDVLMTGGEAPDYKAGTWKRIRFSSAIDPEVSNVETDGATYEDMGSPHPIVTGENWTLGMYIQAHRKSDGHFLEEVEEILKRVRPGGDNTIVIRWYDNPAGSTAKPNPDEAYLGHATVAVKRAQTGNAEIAGFNVTFTGQGPRVKITNPITEEA